MVRRRTRSSKQQTNGGVAVVVSSNVLEEQYFASPKRKDCKIDCNSEGALSHCHEAADLKLPTHTEKIQSESDDDASRTIGGSEPPPPPPPLLTAARLSQKRTIENFFKIQTANSNRNEMNEFDENDECNELLLSSPPPLPCIISNGGVSSSSSQSQNGYIFELSEDTNDDETDQTELTTSDEIDFTAHHCSSSSGSSSSSKSSENHIHHNITTATTTENIFLQEPVLKLDVDKTPNQASSIKINKSIEIEPVFSSPSSAALHGRFNQIVSLNGYLSDAAAAAAVTTISPTKRTSSSAASASGFNVSMMMMTTTPKLNNNCLVLLPDCHNDNSSCDSGVDFISSISTSTSHLDNKNDKSNNNNNMLAAAAIPNLANGSSPRRRKPATPHRILCPSPTKAAPSRTINHNNGRATISPSSPNGRKSEKQILSPRKSPRHLPNVAVAVVATSKTRRRLNPPPPSQHTEKAPYKLGTKKTAVQNGYKHKNGNIVDLCSDDCTTIADTNDDIESLMKNQIDNEDDDDEYLIMDKNSEITALENESKLKSFPETKLKTNLEKSNNTNNKYAEEPASHQHHRLPPPPPAPKTKTKSTQNINKHQAPPLKTTAANSGGNRELTEFFPVRRSVRKTKTAVKEEMMRSLEQAVLEERADGLKVAHFEGKGRGVIADRRFKRGEFVVEYIGDLISMTEATEREKRYALDENAGCYMYYFKHKNQQYCIDATLDTGKLGRLVNHSRNGNLLTKVIVVKQRPHLVLLAKDDILPGEELTYDYGDRSKESLLHHPWLAF